MINQFERNRLRQSYKEYKETEHLMNEGVSNPQNWDYQEWLEYMLIHRTQLLEQSASYADSLEGVLGEVANLRKYLIFANGGFDEQYTESIIDDLVVKAKEALKEAE